MSRTISRYPAAAYPTTVRGDIHQHIHDGNLWHALRIWPNAATLANGATADVLFKSGAEPPHLAISLRTSGNAEVYLYEGTTVSANGTPISNMNHNRQRTIDTTALVYDAPTVTGVGTEIAPGLALGGSHPWSGEGEDSFAAEFILTANTNYLIRMKNVSGGAILALLGLHWYTPA